MDGFVLYEVVKLTSYFFSLFNFMFISFFLIGFQGDGGLEADFRCMEGSFTLLDAFLVCFTFLFPNISPTQYLLNDDVKVNMTFDVLVSPCIRSPFNSFSV